MELIQLDSMKDMNQHLKLTFCVEELLLEDKTNEYYLIFIQLILLKYQFNTNWAQTKNEVKQ